jgi:spermidine synthase
VAPSARAAGGGPRTRGDHRDKPRAPAAPPSAAGFFLLAPLLFVALSHHLVLRTGETYFFASYAASAAVGVGVFLAGTGAGAAALWRARTLPSWILPLVCLVHAALSTVILVAAFFAFGDARWFSVAAVALPAIYGLSVGVSLVAFVRVLPRVVTDGSKVLDLFTFDVLLAAVVVIAAALWGSRKVGSLRTGLAYACVLALIGHLGARVIGAPAPIRRRLRRASVGVALLAGGAGAFAGFLTPFGEVAKVADAIAFATSSERSRVVITSGRGAFQTYVDGVYRESTLDGHRHREATVHPAMNAAKRHDRVLLLGGGDGFSLREIVRWPDVGSVTVVEPDAALVALARRQPILLRENADAFADPRVHVVSADPVAFLREAGDPFDVVIHDIADPTGPLRSKLYTVYFYRLLRSRLAPDGVGAIQTGSPHVMRAAYWCVGQSMEDAGLFVRPYRADIPTFGVWGYYLFAGDATPPIPTRALPDALHMTAAVQRDAFDFPLDETKVPTEPNLLHHQVLLRYRAMAIPVVSDR